MTRPNRVYFEGAVYHVFNRLGRGERVFEEEAEARAFVDVLREVVERDGLRVYAWCLMSNHYHLAVRVTTVALDRPMRSLQQRLTRRVNGQRRVLGPLWQGRYRAKLVNEPSYLDQLLCYIHLNPVTAGVVGDPASHPWSGHRELLGGVQRPIVAVDEVLRLFGSSRMAARLAYAKRLVEAQGEEWIGGSPGHLPWWRVGRPPSESEDPELGYRRQRATESRGDDDRPVLAASEFVELGAEILEVSGYELRGRLRSELVVHAREILATLGVERYRLRVVDLAREMDKSPDTLTKAIARATKRRRAGDGSIRRSFDELDAEIANRWRSRHSSGGVA